MNRAKGKAKHVETPATTQLQLPRSDFREILLRLERVRAAVWCSQAAIVNSEAHDTDDDVGHANLVLVAALGDLEGIHDDLWNASREAR